MDKIVRVFPFSLPRQTFFFCIARVLFQFKDSANLNFGLFLFLMLAAFYIKIVKSGSCSTVVSWKTPGFHVHVALL